MRGLQRNQHQEPNSGATCGAAAESLLTVNKMRARILPEYIAMRSHHNET